MKKLLFISALALIGFTACKDDDGNDPQPVNEEELITTLQLVFKPASGDSVVFSFQDLDGDGSNAPVVTEGKLQANTTYNGYVRFLNETVPMDLSSESYNITLEIEEEDEEHWVIYEADGSLNLTLAYDDQDANGNPIGLSFTGTTGAASTGNLTVTLLHEADKTASYTIGNEVPAAAGGETDIEVTFNVEIEAPAPVVVAP